MSNIKENFINPGELKNQLHCQHMAYNFSFYETLPSTNDHAKLAFVEGAKEGHCILASAQTKGKGRLGRTWFSDEKRGLYFSLILTPALPLESYPSLNLIPPVSILKALKRTLPLEYKLKWPNDILIGGKKLCGILSEIVQEKSKAAVILGVGLNISHLKQDFPDAIKNSATSLALESETVPAPTLILSGILNSFEDDYSTFMDKGPGPILDEWRQHSDMFGQRVSLFFKNRKISGVAVKLDSTGRLILREDNGDEKAYSGGEVTIQKTAQDH